MLFINKKSVVPSLHSVVNMSLGTLGKTIMLNINKGFIIYFTFVSQV